VTQGATGRGDTRPGGITVALAYGIGVEFTHKAICVHAMVRRLIKHTRTNATKWAIDVGGEIAHTQGCHAVRC